MEAERKAYTVLVGKPDKKKKAEAQMGEWDQNGF
jgi:hypothetical protein